MNENVHPFMRDLLNTMYRQFAGETPPPKDAQRYDAHGQDISDAEFEDVEKET